MLSGDKMVEILRAVPPGIWRSYFGRGKLIYHKAIDDFIGKIEEFQDQIVTRIFPINGKFLLNNFEDLCQHLPQLMCSLVYIGRGDDGLILPIIEPEPLEKELSWEHLSFELIQRAEQSYFSYRRTLLSLIYQHKDRRLAYNDLMRQVRLFSDTQHYDDIRKVYWVLYLELMLEIRSFYEKRERNWALDCDLGKHSQLWLGLRSRDLPSMNYLSSTAVKEYLSGAVPQHRDALVGKIQSLMDEYERQLQPDGVQCVLGEDAPPDVDVLPTEAEHEGRGHPEIIQQEGQRPEYLFFQEGDYWTLSYGGEQCRIRKLNGLIFIHYLLSRSGEPVHVSDFVKLVDRPDTSVVSKVDKDSASASRIADPAAMYKKDNKAKEMDVDETVDYEAIQAARDALKKTEEEMALAHEAKDTDREKQLNKRHDVLIEYIQEHTDHRGRPRKVQAAEKKAQERVQKAITRAVERIREYLPDLADHLSMAIETGFECVYKPLGESSTRWQL